MRAPFKSVAYTLVRVETELALPPFLRSSLEQWRNHFPRRASLLEEWINSHEKEGPVLTARSRFRVLLPPSDIESLQGRDHLEHRLWVLARAYQAHTIERFGFTNRDLAAYEFSLTMEDGLMAHARHPLPTETIENPEELMVMSHSEVPLWKTKALFLATPELPVSSEAILESILSGTLHRLISV